MLTARDASNNNVGHGGDTFYIEIKNKWTIDVYGVCKAVAGSKSTLSAPIKGVMVDNGDGTYSFDYSVSFDGAVTIITNLLAKGGVKAQWFSNTSLSPPAVQSNTISNLNTFWMPGDPVLFPGQNYFTSKFFGKLKSPTTETYSFLFKHDDGSSLSFDDSVVINRLGEMWVWINTFTQSLTENTFYDFEINSFQGGGAYRLELYWSSPTISEQIIPSNYFYYGDTVGSSVYQVAVVCPSGFYNNIASSPTSWATLWGDGIKAGSEIWDDGNTVDGDGWQANWGVVTTGFVCSGGSIIAKDTWIQCTRGFYPNTDKNQWITRCGDAIKAGSEGWEDGNSSNGDGCSSNCVVEDGYKCSGGSIYSIDTWTKWSKGFYTDYSNTSQCITKIGDGVRAGSEQWDDENIKDGDGWSSQSKIEDGYACIGGEFGITDVCTQCDLGYDPNPDYSVWVGAVVPLDAKSVALASVVAAFAGVAANAVLAAMTSTSSGSTNSFGMMNQLQLVILIPMLKTYLPDKIYNYLKSMSTSLFNINILPTSDSSSFINFQSIFDYNQQDSYLKLLGLTSGSAFVNILNLMTTIGCIVCIHIIAFILFLIVRKLARLRRIKGILIKILEILTFGFYITVYIETYILFILVDFSEINLQNKRGIKNMKSWVMSYVILGIMTLFILLTLWQWIKSRKTEVLENLKYFKVLVDGMKPKWICRSYFLVFLIRRTLFGVILFFLESYNMITRVILFVVVQFLITAYMIVLRPQQELKEQISDVINEVYFLFFGAFLLYFNTEDRWNPTQSEAYFWILMSNNFVLIFIMLGMINLSH